MEVTVPNFVKPRRRLSLLTSLLMGGVLFASLAQAGDFGFVNVSDRGMLLNQTGSVINSSVNYLPSFNDFGITSLSLPNTVYRLWPNSIVWAREATLVQYFLQPNLQLGVRYNLNFNFNLTAVGDDGRANSVPDGWYKLTMAAVLPEDTASFNSRGSNAVERFLTSYTSFVRVTNGGLNRVITLDYANLTATNVMSVLYVELVPLKDTCEDASGRYSACIVLNSSNEPDTFRSRIEPRANYKPYVIDLPFMPILPPDGTKRDPKWNTVAVNLLQNDLSKFVATARLARERARAQQPPAIDAKKFAVERGLTYMPPSDHAFEVAGRQYWLQGERAESLFNRILKAEDMAAYLKDAKTAEQFLGTICALMSVDYGDLRTMRNPKAIQKYADIWTTHDLFRKTSWCMRNPTKIFAASIVTHIRRFDAAGVRTLLQRPNKFNVMSNFLVARGTSEDWSNSQSVGVSVGLTPTLFKPLDAFGLGIGPAVNFGITNSHSTSTSNSLSTSVANSLMESMDFNTVILNIPAQATQRCLLIRPVNARNAYDFATRWDGRNGLYICESGTQARNVSEIYTQIFSRPAPTSTIDAYDPASQAVNLSLRGDRDISAFFYLTGDKIQPSLEDGTRMMPFASLEGAAKYFAAIPQQAPNVVITSLQLSAQAPIPSFAVKIIEDR